MPKTVKPLKIQFLVEHKCGEAADGPTPVYHTSMVRHRTTLTAVANSRSTTPHSLNNTSCREGRADPGNSTKLVSAVHMQGFSQDREFLSINLGDNRPKICFMLRVDGDNKPSPLRSLCV